MRLIVDASVVIKWAVDEIGRAEARALVASDNELIMPDFAMIEVGNILWKKVVRGEIDAAQAGRSAGYLRNVASQIVPSLDLVPRALQLAVDLGHPIYDCIYLAAAEAHDAVLVTADKRLVNRVGGDALVSRVRALQQEQA